MGYPKEVYDIVKERFESRRFEAKNQRELHKKEVCRVIPKIMFVDKRISDLGLSLLSGAFKDENMAEKTAAAKEQAKALYLQRETLLAENGFPKDYLEVHYSCEACKDTGITDTGYCECFRKELMKEAFKMANLPLMMDEQSFDTLKVDVYPEEEQENMQNIFDICKAFANTFSAQNGENLYMYGAPGLGKTYLSSCIAKAVIERGFGVFYQPAYKIFRIFEDYKFNSENKQLNKSHMERIMNTDLLIIDDLGAEMATSYTAEVLFDLINTRLNSKQSTIINTNLDFPELETIYSERISSRILGGYQLLEFNGEDLR